MPKSARVKKSIEFDKLKSIGKRITLNDFTFVFGKTGQTTTRLGLVVTKKIEKLATRRNLIKRRIREVFRKNRHKLAQAFDIIVIARKNAGQCSLQAVEMQFLEALKRLKP